jgi:hypothetical protein
MKYIKTEFGNYILITENIKGFEVEKTKILSTGEIGYRCVAYFFKYTGSSPVAITNVYQDKEEASKALENILSNAKEI